MVKKKVLIVSNSLKNLWNHYPLPHWELVSVIIFLWKHSASIVLKTLRCESSQRTATLVSLNSSHGYLRWLVFTPQERIKTSKEISQTASAALSIPIVHLYAQFVPSTIIILLKCGCFQHENVKFKLTIASVLYEGSGTNFLHFNIYSLQINTCNCIAPRWLLPLWYLNLLNA